jgi:hypothetical protein
VNIRQYTNERLITSYLAFTVREKRMFEKNQLQQTITERLPLAVIMLALVALVLLVLGTSPVAQAAAITANAPTMPSPMTAFALCRRLSPRPTPTLPWVSPLANARRAAVPTPSS